MCGRGSRERNAKLRMGMAHIGIICERTISGTNSANLDIHFQVKWRHHWNNLDFFFYYLQLRLSRSSVQANANRKNEMRNEIFHQKCRFKFHLRVTGQTTEVSSSPNSHLFFNIRFNSITSDVLMTEPILWLYCVSLVEKNRKLLYST